MAFRADEAAETGFQNAVNYLSIAVPENRPRVEKLVRGWVERFGPVVEGYPSWHPFMARVDRQNPSTSVGPQSHPGVDHTICFVNAFVTCPYGDGGSGAKKVMDGVFDLPEYGQGTQRRLTDLAMKNDLPFPSWGATVVARQLDETLYNTGTEPVLVFCDWGFARDGWEGREDPDSWEPIPRRVAIPMMLEHELPCRHWARVPESWKTMRSYLLGYPHGAVSSLFVERETGVAMRRMWRELMNSGAFGPSKTR